MSDPIFGIFGPTAQEKLRAQGMAMMQNARNPFVMRNIGREMGAILNGERTTPQYQADVARDNARNNILNEASNAGIDIAKDPVGFADSAINTMMTQKYPGYERDVFLMNQWKQIQQANKSGNDFKRAQTANTYGDSGYTSESLGQFHGDNPEVLKQDPNNPKGRGEAYQYMQTDQGPVGLNLRKPEVVDPYTGQRITKRVIDARYNPNLQGNVSGAKKGGELAYQNLDALHKQAIDARRSMQVNQQAEQLLNEGMTTGKFADFRTGFAATLQQMGINYKKDATENAQAYAALMGQQVATIIKQFGSGTGLSDADREFAQQIAGGKIALNEGSIRKIIKMSNQANQYLMQRYQQTYDEFRNSYMPPGMTPPSAPSAAPAAAPTGGAPTLEQLQAEAQRRGLK